MKTLSFGGHCFFLKQFIWLFCFANVSCNPESSILVIFGHFLTLLYLDKNEDILDLMALTGFENVLRIKITEGKYSREGPRRSRKERLPELTPFPFLDLFQILKVFEIIKQEVLFMFYMLHLHLFEPRELKYFALGWWFK